MFIKDIIEDIKVLACEDMTEDGIHHDDWPDHEAEYVVKVLNRIEDLNN